MTSRLARWLRTAPAVAILWSGPVEAQARKHTHVACIGDSITEGAGPEANYPVHLQELMGEAVKVENFGRHDATMITSGDVPYVQQVEYEAATNFVSNAGADAVVSIVIMLGANDSKEYNWQPANEPKRDRQYLEDYRALVAHFVGLGTAPVVYVVLPLSTGSQPCCGIRGKVIEHDEIPLIRHLAQEQRLPVIDLHTPTAGHPEYFSDGVHPTVDAYSIVATLIWQGLSQVLGPGTGASSDAAPITGRATSEDAGIASGNSTPDPRSQDSGTQDDGVEHSDAAVRFGIDAGVRDAEYSGQGNQGDGRVGSDPREEGCALSRPRGQAVGWLLFPSLLMMRVRRARRRALRDKPFQ